MRFWRATCVEFLGFFPLSLIGMKIKVPNWREFLLQFTSWGLWSYFTGNFCKLLLMSVLLKCVDMPDLCRGRWGRLLLRPLRSSKRCPAQIHKRNNLLTIYKPTLVCIFSILFSVHFLRTDKENLFYNQELLE